MGKYGKKHRTEPTEAPRSVPGRRTLYHANGKPVRPGDKVVCSRGEEMTVRGYPMDGQNKVWVNDGELNREFYPSVFKLTWDKPSQN